MSKVRKGSFYLSQTTHFLEKVYSVDAEAGVLLRTLMLTGLLAWQQSGRKEEYVILPQPEAHFWRGSEDQNKEMLVLPQPNDIFYGKSPFCRGMEGGIDNARLAWQVCCVNLLKRIESSTLRGGHKKRSWFYDTSHPPLARRLLRGSVVQNTSRTKNNRYNPGSATLAIAYSTTVQHNGVSPRTLHSIQTLFSRMYYGVAATNSLSAREDMSFVATENMSAASTAHASHAQVFCVHRKHIVCCKRTHMTSSSSRHDFCCNRRHVCYCKSLLASCNMVTHHGLMKHDDATQ